MAEWQTGQQAAINRKQIVTITGVTPKGRAKVGDRMFRADGIEIGSPRNKLEPLTPEMKEIVELANRANAARNDLWYAVQLADSAINRLFGSVFSPKTPTLAEVEKAEALTAAIRGVLEP